MTNDELQYYAFDVAQQAGHPEPELFVAKMDDAELGEEQPMDDIDVMLEEEMRYYEANDNNATAVMIDQHQGTEVAAGYRTTGTMTEDAQEHVDKKFRQASEFGRVGLQKVQDKLFGGGEAPSLTSDSDNVADTELDRLLTELVKSV